MHILSRCRKPFVGSLKNLVICQFWRWHNTKSPREPLSLRFHQAANHIHSFSLFLSLCWSAWINFERVQFSVQCERSETCTLHIIYTNDQAHVDYFVWSQFENVNQLYRNRIVMPQIYWWSSLWTHTHTHTHFIYECDATTRTWRFIENEKFINLNAMNWNSVRYVEVRRGWAQAL